MTIGFDASMINNHKAGINYYAYSLLKAIQEEDKVNEYIIYAYDRKELESIVYAPNFKTKELSGSGNLKWMMKVYFDFLKIKGKKAFISPSNLFFGAVYPNTITVIHDLAKVKYPQFFGNKGTFLYKLELDMLLRREKIIVSSSETVKKELISYYNAVESRIYALGEGLHDWTRLKVSEAEIEAIRSKYSLPEKYFLSVSTLEPRKNYITAIKAFHEFLKSNNDYYYLIAGKKGWFYDHIFKTVKELGLEDRVRFLGYVPEEDLTGIYDLATGILVLSHYEGFGLPIIEALSRRKAVLASNIAVFKEVGQSNVIFVSPDDIGEISRGLVGLVNYIFDEKELNLSNYDWNKVVRELVSLYAKIS